MKKILGTLIALVALAGFATAGEYKDISITDLKKAIDAGEVIVIDVNGSKSFSKAHIPGAIDFRANSDKIATLLGADKDKLVVAYCGGPSCSAYQAGAQAAEKAGFKNVQHLSAGISGWLASKQPTEAAKKDS
ncbi:MAG: rhodanese-related sulfurtransferase [Verrucomicrobiales bacterium]|jgi:rhodanese-related sulfurtransferase